MEANVGRKTHSAPVAMFVSRTFTPRLESSTRACAPGRPGGDCSVTPATAKPLQLTGCKPHHGLLRSVTPLMVMSEQPRNSSMDGLQQPVTLMTMTLITFLQLPIG